MGINPDMGAMCSKSSKKVHNAGSKENQNENESDYPAGGAKDLSLDAIVTLDQVRVRDPLCHQDFRQLCVTSRDLLPHRPRTKS